MAIGMAQRPAFVVGMLPVPASMPVCDTHSPQRRSLAATTAAPWQRRRRLPLLIATGLGLLLPAASLVRAQDLVGCRLVEATLQCLPGLDATPQQQIRILQGEISNDLRQEALVQQDIDGLQQVLLDGRAVEGDLLRARLALEPGLALNGVSYHWYRHAPGRLHWELIPAAQGDSYSISRNDIAYELMVVVVVQGADGVQRASSAPVGPVRVRQPLGTP